MQAILVSDSIIDAAPKKLHLRSCWQNGTGPFCTILLLQNISISHYCCTIGTISDVFRYKFLGTFAEFDQLLSRRAEVPDWTSAFISDHHFLNITSLSKVFACYFATFFFTNFVSSEIGCIYIHAFICSRVTNPMIKTLWSASRTNIYNRW